MAYTCVNWNVAEERAISMRSVHRHFAKTKNKTEAMTSEHTARKRYDCQIGYIRSKKNRHAIATANRKHKRQMLT